VVGSLEGKAKGCRSADEGEVKTSRKVEGTRVESTGVSGVDEIGEEDGSGVGKGDGLTTVGETEGPTVG
jgi:hypothetical protein